MTKAPRGNKGGAIVSPFVSDGSAGAALRLVIDTSSNAMLLVDHKGIMILANSRIEHLFGYSPDELIGQSVDLLVPPRFRTHHVEVRNNFIEKPDRLLMGVRRDVFGLRKDGSEVHIEVSLNPLIVPEGKFVLTAIIDITERENAEERFRSLVNEVSEYSIFSVDTGGIVTSWNTGAERMTGYSKQEILGKHFSCFYTAEDIDSGKPAIELKAAEKTGRFEKEGWRVRKDGNPFWANVVITALRDHEGKLIGYTKISSDLTERRKALADRRKEEERFRSMVSDVSDYGIFSLDTKGLVTSWNAGAERMKGFTKNEILGKHFSCFYPTEDIRAGKPARELEAAEQTGRFEDEGWRVRKNGTSFWANVVITALKDPDGKLIGYTKISRDLTERKKAEERFRLMVEAAPNSMIMVNREGHITLVNAQTEKLFGYRREELIGQLVDILVPAKTRPGHPQLRDSFFSSPKARSMGIGRDLFGVTKSGAEVPVEIGLNPIETPEGLFTLASIIDITERKKAEERFRLMVEAAPNSMIMVNREGRITLVNAQTEKLFGYRREELIGQLVDMLVPVKTRPGHPKLRDSFFASPKARSMGIGRDLHGVTKNGTEVPVEIGLNPIETPEGLFTLASIIDITERKRAEERFRLMVEAAPNAMIMVNREGHITLVNAQTENLFGYRREELIGKPVEILVPVKIRPGHPKLRDSFFAAPKARSMGSGRDLYGVTKNGTEVPVEIGLNPIETPEGLFTLASIIDITERKKIDIELHRLNESLESQVTETSQALIRLRQTQEQLVQAEKMASLGGLVAGVAHEINTPVGIGLTAASHLQDEVAKLAQAVETNTLKRSQLIKFMETGQQTAQMVLSNLHRAAELIRSFKQVAVDQSSDEPRRFNLSQYIGEILVSLHPKLRSTLHRIEVECPTELQLETIPGAVSQILTNLILNSLLHAYDPGQAGIMKISAQIQGSDLKLIYSDDGKGIPPEMLPKIFDPFFTTRRGHGGTGLGLNIVFNLARNALAGMVSVASTLGKGTTFTLVFPAKRPIPSRETFSPDPSEPTS